MKLTVLLFHGITKHESRDPFEVTRNRFLRITNVINKNEHLRTSVILTFDDGLMDHFETFFHLREVGLNGYFFIAPAFIGQAGHLTWMQLTEMSKYGACIGSHTYTHANLSLINYKESFKELNLSKAVLEERIGVCIRDFALPGGFMPRGIDQLMRDTGYLRVYTSDPCMWDGQSKRVPRICIRGNVGLNQLKRIILGVSCPYLFKERIKYRARRAIGPRGYLWLRNMLGKGYRGQK